MAKVFIVVKNRLRLWFQIIFTLLTNGYIYGFIEGKVYKGPFKNICLLGLNCYSCPGALGACPLGSLQAALSGRKFKIPFYIAGILMLIGSIFGRLVCGFMCPFGLFQDLIYKIPIKIKRKNIPGHRYIIYVKYIFLLFFVILLPILIKDISGLGKPWFCKYVCPSGTIMAGIPLALTNEGIRQSLGILFGWKMLVLILVVIVSIIFYRPFCKYICPLGAIYGFFNKISLIQLEIDNNKCTSCGSCQKKCGMDVKVWINPNSMECIRCGDCIDICPHKAIKRKKL